MTYARCTFVTAANTQILSVKIALPKMGDDVPISQIFIQACVQKRAYVELWERAALIFLAFLPRTVPFDVLTRLFREISSSFCASEVVDERELESLDDLEEPFLDEVTSFDFHFDDFFSGNADEDAVWFETDRSDFIDTVDNDWTCDRGFWGLLVSDSGIWCVSPSACSIGLLFASDLKSGW
jgi:hypothetical protein